MQTQNQAPALVRYVIRAAHALEKSDAPHTEKLDYLKNVIRRLKLLRKGPKVWRDDHREIILASVRFLHSEYRAIRRNAKYKSGFDAKPRVFEFPSWKPLVEGEQS